MRSVPALIFTAVALLAGASHAQPKAGQSSKTARAPAAIRAIPAAKIWHTPKPNTNAPSDDKGRPMLVLQALNHTDRVALPAHGERGGFSAEDLDRAAHVLREPS